MYLITRVRSANPARLTEALEWATSTRDYVNANTGLQVSAHITLFGRPLGSITWATFVENRAQWISVGEKLLGDTDYQERARRGAELFLGPPEDSMRQIMHVKGVDLNGPRPAVSQTWTAQIARFQFDPALAWSIEVSDYVAELTDTGVVLLADNYGEFGTLTWIAGFDSAAKADAVNESMLADAGWRKMVANAADLFIDGKTRVWLNRILP